MSVLPEEKRKIGRKKTQPTKKAREAEPRISRRGWKRVNARRRKKTKSFNMDEQDGKSNLNLSCASRASMFNLSAPSDAMEVVKKSK
jgi:hypothetical protein